MARRPLTRRLDVSVRDEAGALVKDVQITFELNGVEIGAVESSDGRADITLPVSAGPVTVKVEADGTTTTRTVAADQSSFTITLKRARATSWLKPGTALSVLLGLVAIVVVLVVLAPRIVPKPMPGPSTGEDKTQTAMEGIARTCLGGRIASNESAITAGLKEYVSGLTAGARVTTSDVGAVTANLKPDGVSLQMYQAYTACLDAHTQNYLRVRGVEVTSLAPYGDAAQSGADGRAAASDASPLRIRGWSYYEHLNGGPTKDGKLMPVSGRAADFGNVQIGTVLVARNASQIRAAAGSDEVVTTVTPPGRCVRVISKGRQVPVGDATSGGWLEVERVACPASAST